MNAGGAGADLAERHQGSRGDVDPAKSLTNYAERARTGDWSLRSALVRLAQPEPLRAEATLRVVRRLDWALHPLVRAIHAHGVTTGATPDGRSVDLARLLALNPEERDGLISVYQTISVGLGAPALADEELAAIPLLELALPMDELGDRLAEWASQTSSPAPRSAPPVELVDQTVRAVFADMDRLGVPEESGPPQGRPRGRV